MIRKFANAQVLDAWRVPAGNSARALRKAAHRVSFAYTPRPGYLYVRARAISSRCNDNWDAFPAGEIEKGYRTFLGKPCFINHHNANHRRARGVIVAAALHRDRNPDGTPDTWVELLHEIDARVFPKLAKAILSGRVNRTSMGVDCEFSTCSACGNRATSPAEYCTHMPAKKGMRHRKRNQVTGKLEESIIHEICAGLTFFENSFLVEDPADPTAYIVDKPYLHPVTGAKTAAGVDLPEASCPNCGSPRARAYSGMHEMAQCSDCGTHYNHFTGREMDPDEVAVTHAAQGNYEDYEERRKAGEELFRHFTPNYTHPMPGWDEAREWRDRANREDMQPHPLSGRPIPKYPGTHGHEDWAAQRREHVVQNWPGAEEFRIPEGPVRREHLSARTAAENEPYMLRMMRHMTDVHGVPHDVLPFLAAQKYSEHHGRPIHPPGASEGPEGESAGDKIRRMTDTGRSMVEANEGIQLAHHELHGHDYQSEGGMAGFRHSHGHDDELAYRQERPYRPDSYRPGEEPPDPAFTSEEKPVLRPDSWRTKPGIPPHMLQTEYKHRLHPERTDEHPNREIYDTSDDPGQWSNLGNCPHTYTRRQQDRAHRAASGEPDPGGAHEQWQAWHEKARRNGAFCPTCGAHKWMHAEFRPSEVGRPKPEWNQLSRQEWDEKIQGKTAPFRPQITSWSGLRAQAITGEEAEPGHQVWAKPQEGTSPVAAELLNNMHTREPEDWYHGLSYHGPYHIIRHPETRKVYLVDRHGRNAEPFGRDFGVPERDGHYRESVAEEHWRGMESVGPDAHRTGTDQAPRFSELMSSRTPEFPHTRIDPEDASRAQRPDARVHEPQGHSPEDEWHGPYEVVKHPQTGKFHVIDNAGRHAPMGGWQGFKTQMQAERSRDYIDRRQQSKEQGAALAGKIFDTGMDVLDPGGTEESRESERNTQAGQELMTRYAGGRGQIKTDPDDEGGHPYYDREHMLPNGKGSGWYTKHYGGPSIDMYHRATGDVSHAMIHLPADEHDQLPDDFDDIELAKHIKAWHDDPQSERSYYENDKYGHQSEPKIIRWKRRHQGARTAATRPLPQEVGQRWPEQSAHCANCGMPFTTERDDPGHPENWRDVHAPHLCTECAGPRSLFRANELGKPPPAEVDMAGGQGGGDRARELMRTREKKVRRWTADDHDPTMYSLSARQAAGQELGTHCTNCGTPFGYDASDFGNMRNSKFPHLCNDCIGGYRGRTVYDQGKNPIDYASKDLGGAGSSQRLMRQVMEQGAGRLWTTDDAMKQSLSSLRHEEALLYKTPEDHPFFQVNPASSENIKHAWFHQVTDDEKDQARRWYPDAHIVAVSIAHGDAAKGAGMLSAYSPLTRWPANMFNAARSIHEGRAMGTQKGDGAIMAVHWRPAQRILAGEHHSQVFSPKTAMKTRAFAHLIEHGGNTDEDLANGTPRVVVDRHALSVAIGRRVTDDEFSQAPISKARYYHHVAGKYIDAARDISHETGQAVDPSVVQAGTWLSQVRRNEAEDATMRGRLCLGRITRGQQDVARWQDCARQHHPDLLPRSEIMHLGALQAMGGDPPLRVPQSVDTLRPEACPVCGNSDVFKGQRCPVCGFVSPPDIFRDPDIDQARLNRQELEEGIEESPYPEGPADEQQLLQQQIGSGEDADEQMVHPDQIAPDGIPGAQPEGAPGQGMLEPSGEQEPELDANGQPVEPQPGGEEELPPEEEQLEGAEMAEEGAEEQQEGEQLQERGAQDEAGEEEAGEEEAEEEGLSPGKEQDEDERPGGKMPKRSAATAAVTASDGAVAELRRENALLRTQLQFIADLAGVGPELEQIRRQADLANPAQPVPDPPQEPPVQSTEEALDSGAPTGSGTGEHRGPGHSEDDPSRPGTTPGSLTAVPAEQTTTAITPGADLPTPPANQLIDVTAPVQGTNPSQDGGVPIQQRRVETDVRVNPNPLAAQGPGIGGLGNDGTAYPWTIAARQAIAGPASAEDERGARTMASIRLARLRVTAGLARGDELEVGAAIEKDARLSLRDIEHEIGTLSQVTRAAAQGQPRYPRGLGPRQAARSAPSFAGQPVPAMAMTAGADTAGDDSDLFID